MVCVAENVCTIKLVTDKKEGAELFENLLARAQEILSSRLTGLEEIPPIRLILLPRLKEIPLLWPIQSNCRKFYHSDLHSVTRTKEILSFKFKGREKDSKIIRNIRLAYSGRRTVGAVYVTSLSYNHISIMYWNEKVDSL